MKAIFQRSSLGWIGLAWSLMVGGMVSAQTVENSPQPSGSSSTLQTYLQERQTLAQQWRALVAQGASISARVSATSACIWVTKASTLS